MHAVPNYPPKFLHSLAIFALTLVACIAWLPMGYQNTMGPLLNRYQPLRPHCDRIINISLPHSPWGLELLIVQHRILLLPHFMSKHPKMQYSLSYPYLTLVIILLKMAIFRDCRSPVLAKCQPIHSWSAIACCSNSHCDSCTLLTASMIVSGDSSQDLIQNIVETTLLGHGISCSVWSSSSWDLQVHIFASEHLHLYTSECALEFHLVLDIPDTCANLLLPEIFLTSVGLYWANHAYSLTFLFISRAWETGICTWDLSSW